MNYRNLLILMGIYVFCALGELPDANATTDTIPDLTKLARGGDWLRLPTGNIVWVEMQDSQSESDEAQDDPGLESASRRSNPAACVSPNFAGVVRKHAKTVPHKGWGKTYRSLDKLVAWLPSDTAMARRQPPIRNDSRRVHEERRNVKVKRAWLLGVYREEDNDFHAILCNQPKFDKTSVLFSIEISGLPDRSAVSKRAYRKLKRAREALVSRLGDLRCGSTFIFREGGLPICVKGSLFFDRHHAGQVHGRKGLNPLSAWEIHPVTKIRWLD